MNIITVDQARADNITAKQLGFAAQWNEAAAKMAKRRNASADVKRHQGQANALRAVAKVLAGR